MIKSYDDLPIWDDIPKLFPEKCRINEINRPTEMFWDWRTNKIHLDYYKNPESEAKIILLHGVGGNGRLLSFIAVPLHRDGFEVIAPDLPGYGITQMNETPSYQDWIEVVNDLIDNEIGKDNKPIIVFGLSAGGMLAYHTACMNGRVSGLIATNFLDQRIQEVRDGSAINKYVSRIGMPFLKLLARVNDRIKLPMKAVANMNAIVNNERILKLLMRDKTSSGTSVPLRLLMSLISADYKIEPEDFDICPVLLAHPGQDRWTPLKLSKLFYDRFKCEKGLIILENAGHFPIEEDAVTQLEYAVIQYINRITKAVQ